jgi:hypothetical protein
LLPGREPQVKSVQVGVYRRPGCRLNGAAFVGEAIRGENEIASWLGALLINR